ncbi:MAG: RNA polymerase-binding protein RbpA [Bifidobacteriaceae bacterium]|nr:RNA polymerase-binding protein RbpA [Bifidobacteriaceae bacterium]
MADRTLRGSGISFQSLESEEGVEFAERQETVYDCPDGHTTILPFALEAEVPEIWQCRCGLLAILRDAAAPQLPKPKRPRSHWDMLLERRTIDELEELLAEQLGILRARRTAGTLVGV